MKLKYLFEQKEKEIAHDFIRKLRKLKNQDTISESRITITIDDEPQVKISQEAKETFINKAAKIGEFKNTEWLGKLMNGLKQVGVQGLNEIVEEEQPVSNKEIRELIGLLIELIN